MDYEYAKPFNFVLNKTLPLNWEWHHSEAIALLDDLETDIIPSLQELLFHQMQIGDGELVLESYLSEIRAIRSLTTNTKSLLSEVYKVYCDLYKTTVRLIEAATGDKSSSSDSNQAREGESKLNTSLNTSSMLKLDTSYNRSARPRLLRRPSAPEIITALEKIRQKRESGLSKHGTLSPDTNKVAKTRDTTLKSTPNSKTNLKGSGVA